MIKSHILSSQKPLTTELVDWLSHEIKTNPTSGTKSLDHLLVVAPTGEAGRRLRLELVQKVGPVIPPKILSPSQLLDALYAGDSSNVATPAELAAILAKTLMLTQANEFTHLLPPESRPHEITRNSDDDLPKDGPEKLTFSWGLNTATRLLSVWDELGRKALAIADVPPIIQNAPSLSIPDEEIARWNEFATLEDRFFTRLHSLHLIHPTELRKQIVQNPTVPATISDIILPPLLDAPPALYDALEKLSSISPTPIHILSLHPDSLPTALSFDSWGRALPLDLKKKPIILPLTDTQFTCAATAREQARALANRHLCVATPTVIGMLDPELLPALESAFLSHNIAVHNAATTNLRETSLGRVINLTWSLIQPNPSCLDLAHFLRETDVRDYLQSKNKDLFSDIVLNQFDDLQARHLPRTREDVKHFAKKKNERYEKLILALNTIDDLLAPPDSIPPRSIAHLLAVLRRLFEKRTLHDHLPADSNFISAANAVQETVRACDAPTLAALLSEDERAALLRNLLASASFSLDAANHSLPLLGWLELPWCPEERLLIAGFNEGCVPSAIVGDTFLPDPLRATLGLGSNDDRFARDTAIFATLLRTHPDTNLHLFLEKQNARGDIKKPSRLLFFCDDATLPPRAKALYEDPKPSDQKKLPPKLPETWKLHLAPTTVESVLKPKEDDYPTLWVTDFKTYLKNPFLFFLKKTLGRDFVSSESSIEIEANDFGDLCHAALDSFGRSEYRNSTDPNEITSFLHREIERIFAYRFKAHENAPLTAILKLQLQSAKERLSYAALEQVKIRQEGWEILATEKELSVILKDFKITGKIDRIDIHRGTNMVRILDYKTGKTDSSSSITNDPAEVLLPFESFLGRSSFTKEDNSPKFWQDLQLPLYRLMVQTHAREIGIPENAIIECGYFSLGEDSPSTKLDLLANLSETAYATAVNTARFIIYAIKMGYYPILSDSLGPYDAELQRFFPESLREGIQQEWLQSQAEKEAAFKASIPNSTPAPSTSEEN